jgi:glyoxylase-like metal-dependent hydrolase (beta-lactamase superfamily II)
MIRAVVTALALVLPGLATAETLQVQPVAKDIWAIIGETEQRSPENLANNASFGLIATPDGAVLIDPGGSWQGAEALHRVIRELTDQPVTHVINTGGQDHRWLGNGYWRAEGATIIASQAAVADQTARGTQQMSALARFLGNALEGTEPAYADITFEADHRLEIGGLRLDITNPGPAHTPGDSFVWIEARDVMFSGDIVYVDRILGVGPQSNVRDWIDAFEVMAAHAPAHIVPGHGPVTDLDTARRDTLDYLENLRARIGAVIETGGDIMDAPGIDQSDWAYLKQFDSLAGRNAQTTYEQMEWE